MTVRWSRVGPPLPTLQLIAAFGSPVLDSRMKYAAANNGPLEVTVQPLTDRCQSSATPRQTWALAVSWLVSAMSAAEISPAISAAMVEGEYPPCSSQRSGPKLGPWLRHRAIGQLLLRQQEGRDVARSLYVTGQQDAGPSFVGIAGEDLAVRAEIGVRRVTRRDGLAPGRSQRGRQGAGVGLVLRSFDHVGAQVVLVDQVAPLAALDAG